MAQKVTTQLVDDIDGSEAHETISFGYQGKQYEIDLNDKNAAALHESLSEFAQYARTVTAGCRQQRVSRRTDKERTLAIREWAASNGHEIAGRGRIPREVVEAYDAANGG